MTFAFTLRCVAATLLAVSIVGCATSVPPPPPSPASAATPSAAPAAAGSAVAPGAPLPDVNLTGGLLFQLMAAEAALQRGDSGTAYATFLGVARSTRDPRLARRATEVALAARALPQALEAARLWRELAPADEEAQQALPALLIGTGRYDEALPLYAQQIARNPAVELAQVQRLLARTPDRKAGFDMLQKLAAPYVDDPKHGPDALLALANGALAAGDPALAVRQAQAALALRPDHERAALLAAQLLAQPEGKPSKEGRAAALQLLQAFLDRNPAARDVRMTYARLLVADGRYADARQEFARIVQADPADLDALYAAGVMALETPPPRPEARRYFEQYLQALEQKNEAGRDPDPAYLNLARIAEDEGRLDEALTWLERVDAGEQYLTARLRKALVLGKLKRLDEARALLAATATENAEERTALVLTEGQLLREAGRHRESFDLLATALAKAPQDPALLYDTAMAAEKLNRIDLMEQHLRLLMKLKPDDAHAYNALGYSLADRNLRLQEAYELIEQAVKLAPQDAYILDSRGWVYFRLGNLDKAREYLGRAWSMKPHAEVGAHYGEVLWQQGERDAARRVWRESRQLEPDNETLKTTLQRLKVRL